ncbi:MAG: hypothetical protein DWQ02_07495 [Bacteroidetes bacterium]|nr:MAG: hypothetical protein DWQ02_07495 [Bacteroidota bacterium]
MTFSKSKNIFHSVILTLVCLQFGNLVYSQTDQPTVSVAVDKMNVLYIGVDNPLTIAVAGFNSEDLTVESKDLQLVDLGNGHYNAIAKTPGRAFITVTAGGVSEQVRFRVKRIPDPVARIGNSSGGSLSVAVLQKTKRLDAIMYGFDFDAQCAIQSFNLVFVPKKGDPTEVMNRGGLFNGRVLDIMRRIKPGDVLYFEEVKCKCPGDLGPRVINSLVFKVK